MKCHDLAQRIASINPDLSPLDVARLCLLVLPQIANNPHDLDDERLMVAWRNAAFRLEAASDQHCAVAAELHSISVLDSVEFSEEQLRVLLRAIKVQSQILELYTHDPVSQEF